MAKTTEDSFDKAELQKPMEASLHDHAPQPLLEGACPLQPLQIEEALIPSQFAEAHSSPNSDASSSIAPAEEAMEASLHGHAPQPLLEEACPLQPLQIEETLIPSQFEEAHSSPNSDTSSSTAPTEEAMEASLHGHAPQPLLEEACPLQPLQIEETLIPSQFEETHSSPNSDASSSIAPAEVSSPNDAKTIEKEVVEGNEDSHLMKQFCGICLEDKYASEIFDNKVCSHGFCSTCINQLISRKLQENLVSIDCPEPDCSALLTPEQCLKILPKETFEEWSSKLVKADVPLSQKFYCPFRDCSALLLKDVVPDEIGCSSGAAAVVITESECPNCRRLFCAQCSVPWHAGLDCSEVQKLPDSEKENSDLMLFKLAKENEWQRCAKCKYIIERNTGCCHMTCRCGYEFCYKCGLEMKRDGTSCKCSG